MRLLDTAADLLSQYIHPDCNDEHCSRRTEGTGTVGQVSCITPSTQDASGPFFFLFFFEPELHARPHPALEIDETRSSQPSTRTIIF